MMVDLILEPCVSPSICSRLTFQYNGAAIRHDQPCPNEEHAGLAERHLAIVNSYQTRALRHGESQCLDTRPGLLARPRTTG